MNVKEYQEFARATSGAYRELSSREGRVAAAALGLVGEAGETSEVIKKWLFHRHPYDANAFIKELGDVLWYVTELCNATGIALEEVLQANVVKLKARYPDGWSATDSITRKDESVQGV